MRIVTNVSVVHAQAVQREPVVRLVAVGAVMVLAGLLAACQGPQPGARTVFDFKEDSVARDGVLSRCDNGGEASANDQECIAARRVAAAIALEQERSRTGGLERQSERKLVALRDRDPNGPRTATAPTGAAPAFGAPLGRVLPSIGDSVSLDPLGTVPLPGRPSFQLGQVEPPASEIEIEPPKLSPEDIAVVPARLHAATN